MMNRGKLEAWAVRLFMIRYRYQIAKKHKEIERKHRAVMLTKLNEKALIEYIEALITGMEDIT